jgi:hypothetical protein
MRVVENKLFSTKLFWSSVYMIFCGHVYMYTDLCSQIRVSSAAMLI